MLVLRSTSRLEGFDDAKPLVMETCKKDIRDLIACVKRTCSNTFTKLDYKELYTSVSRAKEHFSPDPPKREVYSYEVFDKVSESILEKMVKLRENFNPKRVSLTRLCLYDTASLYATMLVRVLSLLCGCRRSEVSSTLMQDLHWIKRENGKKAWRVEFNAAKTKSKQVIHYTLPSDLVHHFTFFLIFWNLLHHSEKKTYLFLKKGVSLSSALTRLETKEQTHDYRRLNISSRFADKLGKMDLKMHSDD
jgi:hypothetical protein